MRLILFLSLCLNLIVIQGISQQKDTTILLKNTVFIDFSTKGAIYSINFDRIFYQKKINSSYRFGLSILKEDIAFPIGLNLFTGKENSHLEFSLVIIPYIFDYKSLFSKNDSSDKVMYIVPGIGYRYQKPKGGFFFRATVSPMIFLDPPSINFWKMDTDYFISANVGMGFSF